MPTTSNELALGTPAPAFTLPDVVSGRTLSLDEIAAGKPVLVMFLCRHCPYVKHVEAQLAQLARDYAGKKIALVAISANDAEHYPEDAPESLAEQARAAGFTFPYCYDESQAVARAYKAVCTPEFFLFSGAGGGAGEGAHKLVYHGQLDSSRPGNRAPLNGQDLRAAIDSVLDGRPVAQRQVASVGCSIKWKKD